MRRQIVIVRRTWNKAKGGLIIKSCVVIQNE